MPESKWDDRYYLRVFVLARGGCPTHKQAAGVLGVVSKTFDRWIKEKPALQDAWAKGVDEKNGKLPPGGGKFREYVFNRLPPRLQAVWENMAHLNAAAKLNLPGKYAEIVDLLSGVGDKIRQRLFLHAITNMAYDVSAALNFCALPKKELDRWLQTDYEFVELFDEIQFHRGNFFESALVQAVAAGEVPAIIFANKTLNAARGYNEKITHEHTGRVEMEHSNFSIEDLDLPLEVKIQVLEAVRKQQRAAGLAPLPGVVEGVAEFLEFVPSPVDRGLPMTSEDVTPADFEGELAEELGVSAR